MYINWMWNKFIGYKPNRIDGKNRNICCCVSICIESKTHQRIMLGLEYRIFVKKKYSHKMLSYVIVKTLAHKNK